MARTRERHCPNQQMGCKWRSSAARITKVGEAINLGAEHFNVCPMNASVIQALVETEEEAQ